MKKKSVKWLTGLCIAFATICVVVLLLIMTVSAETINGECGENVTWVFETETGVLTISGMGDMTDYSGDSVAPWKSYGSSIKSVVIENGVTSIGNSAFDNCTGITSITIPNSVTSIGDSAFNWCRSLESVVIGSKSELSSIGNYAFYHCDKLEMFIYCGSKWDTISKGADWNYAVPGIVQFHSWVVNEEESTSATCDMAGIEYSECSFCHRMQATSIDAMGHSYEALQDCEGVSCVRCNQKITWIFEAETGTLTISGTEGSMENYIDQPAPWASYMSSVKTVVIEEGLTNIGVYAFYNYKELTNIKIPNSIKTIGAYAFDSSSLVSVTLPNSVSVIEQGAFWGCGKLKSIVIPSSVKYIGNHAFFYCKSLDNIIFCGTQTQWNSISKGYMWNEGVPGEVRFHNFEQSVCTECGASCTHINYTQYGSPISETCTTWGYILYNCSDCGGFFTRSEDYIPPHNMDPDHEWLNIRTVEATCVADGYSTKTCSICETEIVVTDVGSKENAEHDWNDGVCTECGELKPTVTFVGASVNLGEDITIKYYVNIPDAYAGAQMRFTMNGKEVVIDGTYIEDTEKYMFVFERVAPQHMGDNIKAELIYNGELIAEKDGYSIRQNVINLLDEYADDEKMVALLKAMLNYGAAAQTYRNYKTDALVNSGYEIEATAPESNVSVRDLKNNTGDEIFKTAGVHFSNVNKIYVRITAAEKPTVTVNGVEATVKASGEGLWSVYTDGIVVSDFDETYTFVITSNANQPTLTYSVNSYTYAKQTSNNEAMRELATATYAYGAAAEAYIAK